jgi:hypothetical protein
VTGTSVAVAEAVDAEPPTPGRTSCGGFASVDHPPRPERQRTCSRKTGAWPQSGRPAGDDAVAFSSPGSVQSTTRVLWCQVEIQSHQLLYFLLILPDHLDGGTHPGMDTALEEVRAYA